VQTVVLIQKELTKEERQDLYATRLLKGASYVSSCSRSHVRRRSAPSIYIGYNPLHEDIELKIKALNRTIVGDWHRHDISQEEEEDIVVAQIAQEVEDACKNGTIQVKIEAEQAEEEALELGITKASLRASTSQRCNRYFLANEEEEEEEGSGISSSSNRSESQESNFDSSDDNDEEDGDHIM